MYPVAIMVYINLREEIFLSVKWCGITLQKRGVKKLKCDRWLSGFVKH